MQPAENTPKREYAFTPAEQKLFADLQMEALRIKTQAEQALRDLAQRSHGAMLLIIRQHGLEGEWETLPDFAGLKRKEPEPPKE